MTATAYDSFLYPSQIHPLTHPARLGGVGKLFGLHAAPASRARVLELGGGDGSNLMPLAARFPDATFVGIDLAPSPIELGTERAKAAGITNLQLIQGDATKALALAGGGFDYVIAHGLYSWVPDSVRAGVIEAIAQVLAPTGIGYVSFNALPGCRMRHLVKDLLDFELAGEPYDKSLVPKARAALGVFERLKLGNKAPFFEQFKSEVALAQQLPDYLLFHDDLAPGSRAFYLHEIDTQARAAGLQYLSDAHLASCLTIDQSDKGGEWLESVARGSWMRRQQYLDYLLGRRFECALFCHADVALDRSLGSARLADLYFASAAQARGRVSPLDGSEATFNVPLLPALKVNNPVFKLVLMAFEQHFPDPITIAQAVEFVQASKGTFMVADRAATPGELTEAVEALLRQMISRDSVTVLAEPGRARATPAALERPALTAFARWCITNGIGPVTPLHEQVAMQDNLAAALALQYDGSRSQDVLAAWLFEARSTPAAEKSAKIPDDQVASSVAGLAGWLSRQGLLEPGI